MKLSLSLSLSLILGCYFSAFAQVSIIGGVAIDISEAPYQVSIELENGVHDCGGMILSERWILTAAHCVFNSGLDITSPLLENLVVHAGSTNQTLDNVGQRINVESIVVNPNYDPPFTLTTIEHDLALLYLESPLEFNTNVQPRRYADFCNTQLVDIASGEMASIAGWGRTAFSPPPIDNLNFAEIPIVSTAEANTINEQVLPGSGTAVTANNIAFYDSEVQQGSGDSGGPFLIEKNDNSLAVGIVSWSLNPPDGTLAPSIAAQVREYSGWIETASGISSSTSGLDLFMKDRPWDLGKEPSNVEMGWVSEDIWIRNQPDGFENHTTENPEFSLANSVYVYVRVRNRGCIASTGTEQLTLAWAKASTSLTWPDYWDGSTTFGTNGPLAGDEIDVQVINEVIEPGSSAILEFEWGNMPDPSDYEQINDEPWHFCLLARLISNEDPMAVPENTFLNDNVISNNNIAWKNVTMVDFAPGLVGNDHYFDAGVVSVGNYKSEATGFEFHFFEENTGDKPIVQEAEIICTLGADLWTAWIDGGMQGTGVSVHKYHERQLRIHAIDAKITNCALKADDQSTLALEFAFLTSEATTKNSYDFHLVQKEAGTERIVGGELFKVVKRNANRYLFQTYAGSTITVVRDELVQLSAISIGEPAVYNWYNASREMLYSGFDFSFEADTSMLIILETIADDDGFKDYDQVFIEVLQHYIEIIYPVPTSETITVSYSIKSDLANSAQLEIASQSGFTLQTHVIDITMSNKTVNVSSLPIGVYTVRLLVDGVLTHSKTISKI